MKDWSRWSKQPKGWVKERRRREPLLMARINFQFQFLQYLTTYYNTTKYTALTLQRNVTIVTSLALLSKTITYCTDECH